MPFQPVSMHSIRSSNQRALAAQWNALATDRGFPAIGAFNPQATGHSPEQMILWDVESTGEADGCCFRVRKVGLRAVEAIGESPIGPIGKTMEELAPPLLREISLNGARECATSGCAIYEIITTVDANAHVVECERLLLPFGDGEHVEQIVASLQLISFQGAIERQGFVREFVGQPQLTFAGMILSDAMTRRGASAIAARAAAVQGNGPAAPTHVASASRGAAEPGSTQQGATDKRKAARRTVLKTARIRFEKSSEICTVRDMSATGAAIDLAHAASIPDRFTLVLEMESAARNCTVVWRKDRQLGVRFG
jgi:PilZ domain